MKMEENYPNRLETPWDMEKLLVISNQHLLLFPQCFQPYERDKSAIYQH